MNMISFFKNLFGSSPKPQSISLEERPHKEKSLNEKNALRALKEKEIIERKKKKAKLLREKADKAFSESVVSYYNKWLEEFQFRLHMEVDKSDLRYNGENEVEGTITLGGCTFSVTTKIGTISRHSVAVCTYIDFKAEGLENPLRFAPYFIRNSLLVGEVQPAVQANECISELKKQAQIIHMHKVVNAREERKRLKREKLERNRLRNIARKEASSFEQLNQLVICSK